MAKNNVLLIWPKTDPGFYDFSPLNAIFKQKGQFTPLPLLTIAAELGNDWKYVVADEEAGSIDIEAVKLADYFFISANILQKKSLDNLIDTLKIYKKPIIIGGPLLSTIPAAVPDNVIKVIGELESIEEASIDKSETLAQMLSRDMKQGKLKNIYKATGHPDLGKSAIPRYDLVNLPAYFITMQTSRGCHHYCDFCQLVPLYGRHHRKSAPTNSRGTGPTASLL